MCKLFLFLGIWVWQCVREHQYKYVVPICYLTSLVFGLLPQSSKIMQRAPTECGIQPSCINQDVCRIPQERCTPVFSGREAEAQPLPLRTWVMGEAQLRCETIALTLLMLTNVDQFFFCNSQFECYFSLLGMAICGIRAPKSSLPSFFTFCTLTPFLHLLLLLRIAFSACSIYRNSCLPSG